MYGFANINYQGPPTTLGNAPGSIGADNGLSLSTADPTKIVLGQDVGQAGNPGILLSDREIPMSSHVIEFTGANDVKITLFGGNIIAIDGNGAAGSPAWIELRDTGLTGQLILKRERNDNTLDGWVDQMQNNDTGELTTVYYNDDGTLKIELGDGKAFNIFDHDFPTMMLDYNSGTLVINGDTTVALPEVFLQMTGAPGTNLHLTLNTTNTAGIVAAPFLNLANFAFIGDVNTKATAVLHLKAGTATAATAPLKFTAGTLTTTPESGAMEFNGSNYFLSRGLSTREFIVAGVSTAAPTTTAGTGIANFYGSSATNFLGTPTGWILGNFGGVGGRIPFY